MGGGVPGGTIGGQTQRTVWGDVLYGPRATGGDRPEPGSGSGAAPIDALRRAKCGATGGTWNQEAQTCEGGGDFLSCSILPQPLKYACENPGKVVAGFAALTAAWFLGPPILHKVFQTTRAVQA